MQLRNVIVPVVAGLVLFGGAAAAQEGLPDADLLAALDAARFLDGEASQLTVEILARSADDARQARLRLSFKEFPGEERVRIDFLAPEELAGQVFLVTAEATYFWQPDLFSPLNTSGAQAAFGDAAVAQVGGIRFAGAYRISGRRMTADASGNRQLELQLQADRGGLSFPQITAVVAPEALRPVELELIALSGKPLYRVKFAAYAELQGDVYVREQLVENLLVEGSSTRISVVSAAAESLPDSLFDPQRLGDPR
ncbi:MAG: outer membrane lipoprotein-sorting protein [Candidatus Bipolaricaulaceae bacterium]